MWCTVLLMRGIKGCAMLHVVIKIGAITLKKKYKFALIYRVKLIVKTTKSIKSIEFIDIFAG